MANHVIFVSPFLTERKEAFEAEMIQAEGRARRYGQMKFVHVYKFLALNTIDVDIMENMTGKQLVKLDKPIELEDHHYRNFKSPSYDLVNRKDTEETDKPDVTMTEPRVEELSSEEDIAFDKEYAEFFN